MSSPQTQSAAMGAYRPPPPGTTNLADVLERVLDKGMVIAGDITISLLDIELLTIKLRLLIASVDRAREMGIDWWERDSSLSGPPKLGGQSRESLSQPSFEERIQRLEQASGLSNGDGEHGDADRS
jgi:gas vesicle protein GvpA/GvpJ/GvpM family